jgi:PPM family protein phosphatase
MAARQGNWEGCFAYAAISDIGLRRENNQDEKAVVLAPDFQAWLSRGHVLMVADGMGAHAAGELASKLAVDGVPHLFHKYLHLSAPEALQRAVQETNAEVHRRGQANIDFNNMGTTASVLLLMPQGAVVAHVGDSRVYRLRGRKLEQWTFDHSLVWELRAKGQLPRDQELANAIPKNVITRSLGPYPFIQADIEGPLPLEKGDLYLLCTDGLTGRIDDEELAAVLAHVPFESAPQLLVDIANLRGGPDNVTVVLGRITDERMETRTLNQPPLTVSGG